MPPRKAASNGNKANENAVVQPFKYRSITDIEKKKVEEFRRGQLEGEHYRIGAEIDVLEEQPLPEQPGAAEERAAYIQNQREQQLLLEGMIRSHNERIADIDSALVAEKE